MEKILPSIIAALLPFLFTFFSKKNKDNLRRNLLEEAQRRVDFINSYFETQIKVSASTEAESLKNQLAVELHEIKNNINDLYKKEAVSAYEKLSVIQIAILYTFSELCRAEFIFFIHEQPHSKKGYKDQVDKEKQMPYPS